MKAMHFIIASCVVSLLAVGAHASVFSGSGGSSLQSLFNDLGYDQIDVADYQTDLNFSMQGMMEFEVLSANRNFAGFGVLETAQRRWGRYHRHHRLMGRGEGVGSTAMFDMSRERSSYGFFIETRRARRTSRYYSYSPFNRRGAVQALFYQNPLNSGEYLLAFEGLYVGSSHSDQRYDDVVLRMRRQVHAAPEPATWVLLASGLAGIGIFARGRRRADRSG